jgi:hypothetical protein
LGAFCRLSMFLLQPMREFVYDSNVRERWLMFEGEHGNEVLYSTLGTRV